MLPQFHFNMNFYNFDNQTTECLTNNLKKMKTYKTFTLTAMFLLTAVYASAQTADEIIAKYLQAIGGKDQISKINSLYIEGNMEVMGMSGPMKTTTLSGKGYKQEMEIMGSVRTTCFNDKAGWSISSGSAEAMPEAQYNAGKGQIFIGAPFVFYAEKGYKAELLGNEAVESVNAYKIKLTAPDSTSVIYYFDPATGYLIKTVQQSEMQGQMVESTITYSDYRQTDGYTQPYKMVTNYAGMIDITNTVTKVEVNKAIDESVFIKPL